MSRPQTPKPAKLVIGFFLKEKDLVVPVIKALIEKFGPVDIVSSWLPFNFTTYYEPEMGAGLQRRLLSFTTLIMPDELPGIKLATNKLENEFSSPDGKRSLNIDPGYIALCHLILATGKAFTHRPYLRDGIYADLTLVYRGGRFQTLEWTFPDYGSEEMLKILTMLRARYFEQLKKQQCGT